jgi:protein ImuA
MFVSPEFSSFDLVLSRTAALSELRRLLACQARWGDSMHARLPFGLATLDSHLPNGGLAHSALHEIVPAKQAALPAALGFVVAVLARLTSRVNVWTSPHDFPPSSLQHGGREKKVVFVIPAYARRQCGRLSGQGLNNLGFDPRRAIMVETAHRQDTLWAVVEALRSSAPQAVAALIDRLDLKISQKLHFAAVEAGLPLLLLRPLQTLESSAAATRWRVAAAPAARDRFGSYARARWRLQLERCRNGRPGEWVVEYDHVAHRFSLVAALADLSFSRGTDDQSCRQDNRS